MCTGKRQTHIRNAPSSRTAVTGIDPYTETGSAYVCAAAFRKNQLHSAGRTESSAPRVYLKTPNAPGQRTFSRCAAPFFLEIRQYSCEKMSCSAQKFLAAGHIGSFQIHPTKQSYFDHDRTFLTRCVIFFANITSPYRAGRGKGRLLRGSLHPFKFCKKKSRSHLESSGASWYTVLRLEELNYAG